MNLRAVRPKTTSTVTFLVMIFLIFSALEKVTGNNDAVRFSEKVNLALRRTAHLLLVENGDSISTITPVQQLDANTFAVRIDKLFDYDNLPDLLQKSLKIHGIDQGYDVSVLHCENSTIILGYSFQDLNQKEGVPCNGRKLDGGCYVLQVSFYPELKTASATSNWWILPLGSLLAGLGFVIWKRNKKDTGSDSDSLHDYIDNKINFGSSAFDMNKLILISESKTYNLTYREAKLLHLFTSNQNKILERDFILKSVWEDEGIIVSRSVDVFVSRLRKMLTEDSKIKIAAVHGIGYRMEVTM
ncbi:helix-turn-helix domain-containing protein [Dyadobacter sp. CY345]|uniref:winged helix-turn-helix domain-containing protein n=1 Tax=Dyadobacter sp. CY345 TaxID=2909335 RepID=UPI001F45C48D|nr:helix-turn-helix domain-containing protein [Dyadobacter sp. CY345]MCF2443763.1 helix-turn-helix domain-containing protein [Dyadobacter sp. CY345]